MAYHMYILYTIVDTVYTYVMDIRKRIKRELGKYPCFHIRPLKNLNNTTEVYYHPAAGAVCRASVL